MHKFNQLTANHVLVAMLQHGHKYVDRDQSRQSKGTSLAVKWISGMKKEKATINK